jgi:signal transduction histidine kinase
MPAVPPPDLLLAGSPFALALAAGALWLRRRRRLRLWQAVHELRRPLQGLALAIEQGREEAAAACFGQARRALADLEDELDHAPRASLPAPVRAVELLAGAERRWCGRIIAESRAPAAAVRADPVALERAVDNLIANALEHGTAPVRVCASVERGWLVVEVRDGGPRAAPVGTGGGGPRRGHGLRIAAAIAGECGGRLLPPAPRSAGTRAALRLPLAGTR